MEKNPNLRNFSACCHGSNAVEFALVAPVLLLLVFGIITFGTIFATYSDVQQLAAESARATLGGISDSERDTLARSFVVSNIKAYPLLDQTKLAVSTTALPGTSPVFRVDLSYDMSGSFIYSLFSLMPLPKPTIIRSAVVQISS